MSKHHRHGKVRVPSAPYINWEQMQSGTTRDREWTRGILAEHASHAPAATREQHENTFANRAASVIDAMRDAGLSLGVPDAWFKRRNWE